MSSCLNSPDSGETPTTSQEAKTDVKHLKVLTANRGLINVDMYSIPVNEVATERKLKVYGADRLMKFLHKDATTLLECLQRGYRRSTTGDCLGRINQTTKSVEWLSYGQVLTRLQHFGDGLCSLGQSAGSIVGMFAGNRVEYNIAEYGCYWQSISIAPIYHTLGPDACLFIANQTQCEVIVCDTAKRAQEILSQVDQMNHFKYLVTMDEMPSSLVKKAKEDNIQVFSMKQIEELGKTIRKRQMYNAKSSDLAVICYTSGTTGTPKGAMLTHENIVSCASAIVYQMFGHNYSDCDVFLSYLPLAHVMERIAQVCCLMEGCKIGYFSGDIQKLSDDMQIVKPTIFLTVPRLINRIVDKIFDSVRGNKLKEWLLKTGIASKIASYQQGKLSQNTIWDKLIFDKVRNNLGGRVRIVVSGSALLDPKMAQILRCALGCALVNGFGQSECGICTLQIPFDKLTNSAGAPLASCCVKLADIPEMNYYLSQGKGEIRVKGPIVTLGYFNDPVATQKLFDEEGWLRTGDIGRWTKEGTLQIIDRIKNQFKLSQGEFIAVEKLQSTYEQSLFVSQMYIYGDSSRSYLVAIVVPDKEFLENWAQQNGIHAKVLPQLCSDQLVVKAVFDDLQNIAQTSRFNKLEYIKKIHLHPEAFTLEAGLLTPTMKLKRHEVHKYFSNIIEKLYM